MIRAYLDIETDGLSAQNGRITLIGIALQIPEREEMEVVQLVGHDADAAALIDALSGVDTLYTYNGSRFDLPFIRTALGVDLAADGNHRDLMYSCWKRGLYGGLKAVEKQLGIGRATEGVNGLEAVRLWNRYVDSGDLDALDLLMRYNAEDVVNLAALRQRLRVG